MVDLAALHFQAAPVCIALANVHGDGRSDGAVMVLGLGFCCDDSVVRSRGRTMVHFLPPPPRLFTLPVQLRPGYMETLAQCCRGPIAPRISIGTDCSFVGRDCWKLEPDLTHRLNFACS